jgi:CxxC motif-containing protein
MTNKLTCIECPKGCVLSIDVEDGRVVRVSGHKCPKGQTYAASEIENPVRVLTSTVLAQGLSLKMVPVRTDRPIPKARVLAAMAEVKRIRVDKPLKAGAVVVKGFLGLEANLIATREVF